MRADIVIALLVAAAVFGFAYVMLRALDSTIAARAALIGRARPRPSTTLELLEVDCPSCEGGGEVVHDEPCDTCALDGGVAHSERCPTCWGRGILEAIARPDPRPLSVRIREARS